VFGQKRDISGSYYAAGQRIIVANDSLKLEFTGQPSVPSRVLAETTFKWVDKNFIEINSTPPYILLHKRMKIERSMDPTITDSLKLLFYFPNYTNNHYDDVSLKVSIFSDKNYNLTYSENNNNLMVPIPKISDHIIISIENPIYYGELDGSFYGFRYVSMVYAIDKNVNNISIEIPAIDNSFFEKYYVKGEYARVFGNKIEWKGEVFVKRR
jgi:hypothetical protein